MNRRDFVKNSVLLTASLALPVAWDHEIKAGGTPDAVIAKGDPGPAVRAAVEGLGGMEQFVKKGDKVVVKPNMSFSNPPSWATTTHPDVIKEIVSMCVAAGAGQVLVLDNTLRDREMCIEQSGIAKACEVFPESRVLGLKEKKFFKDVPVPQGRELKSTAVMKDVLDANVVINAPVAKTHSSAGVSLSMKNMMGVIYDRAVFHYLYNLHTAIVDLCTVAKAHLTVVDATRLLSTGGPGGPGKVLQPRKVIASTDMVAADAITVDMGEWYGRKFEPHQVKHIREAHERGLGRMDIDQLNIKRVNAG